MECIRQIEGTTDEFTIRGDFISTTSAEIAGHYEMEEVEGEPDLFIMANAQGSTPAHGEGQAAQMFLRQPAGQRARIIQPACGGAAVRAPPTSR